ncbi:sensor histidine kinase [Streptacidiphilus fuscans]|uniref:histidine kinase n=1 Tax=Streptacidiphilus fuscans TaxID=2789292 RepID=A0A931FJE2_9ACTN|nr:histidine kinase [Streptacidiphilus fuscans]MBF9067798.1 sensor histidine kinase [Streptacidiphilus fuscans]MBF9073881.1 sensor histidine kinase [Streptacidiphilus fuscans]
MRVGAWQRRRSMWLDLALAAAAALECAGSAYTFTAHQGLGLAARVAVAVYALVAGATLVVRRRWPLVPVAAALSTIPLSAGYLLLMIGLYTLGAYRPEGAAGRFAERRAMSALCAVAIAETVLVSTLTLGTQHQDALHQGVPEWVLILFSVLAAIAITVPPTMLGLYIGAKRRLWVALTERAEGLETELGLLADQARERALRARVEERTRIAREMHDVVAHRVSLMVVHAGALERVVHKDPEKAAASAKLMGDIGRQALDELRQILGVLRTVEPNDDDSGGAPVGASGTASGTEYVPMGVADLPKLVDESRAAGLGVRFTLGGARRTLTSEAEQTAYRVVQEALTNVLKHAPGADVEVVVAYVPGGVALAVSNTCPPAEQTGEERDATILPSGGNGLVGMRERVTALGGAFTAGPTAEGGFRVEARLLAAR